MTVPWYDDPPQIAAKLTDLEGLRTVLDERAMAGQSTHSDGRGEQLQHLVLLGKIATDERGEVFALERNVLPPDVHTRLHRVCTFDAFDALVKRQGTAPATGEYRRGRGWKRSYRPPTVKRRCPICGQGWTLDNCEDVVAVDDSCVYPLGAFVGMTMEAVVVIIADLPEGHFQFGFGPPGGTICISPIGHPSHDSLYRTEGSAIIGPSIDESREWQAKLRYVDLSHVVQPDDGTTGVFRYRSYHGVCYEKVVAKRLEEEHREMMLELQTMLERSGFTHISITEDLLPPDLMEKMKEADEGNVSPEYFPVLVPYFEVRTAEGKFGVLVLVEAAMYLLDLTLTGLRTTDFGSIPEECHPVTLDIIPIDSDGVLLLKLRKLLLARKRP